MSGSAPQGLRHWATSLRHCLWPALLILASLAALCFVLTLRQRIAVKFQLSGMVYPEPLVLAQWGMVLVTHQGAVPSDKKELEGKYRWSLHQLVPHSLQKSQLYAQNMQISICSPFCEGDVGSMGWTFTFSASNSMFSLHPPLFHYIIGLCIPGIQWLLPGVVDLPLLFWPPLQTPTWICLLDLVSSDYLGFTISQLLEGPLSARSCVFRLPGLYYQSTFGAID